MKSPSLQSPKIGKLKGVRNVEKQREIGRKHYWVNREKILLRKKKEHAAAKELRSQRSADDRFCGCGCGTKIIDSGRRFLSGHNFRESARGVIRERPRWSKMAWEDGSDGTCRLRLRNALYAVIDSDQLCKLEMYTWMAFKGYMTFYAMGAKPSGIGGKAAHTFMHRIIVNAAAGEIVDHVDGDGLNNRMSNLRIVEQSINVLNRHTPPTGRSRYRGIWLDPKYNKWHAQINKNHIRYCLGAFRNEVDAAAAYDRAAIVIHGEHAQLNFGQK